MRTLQRTPTAARPVVGDVLSGKPLDAGAVDRDAWSTTTAARAIGTQVLGYASLCDEHGNQCRAEFARQVDEIASECERRGLRLLDIVRERERQHQRLFERPGLEYVLGRIATGDVGGLVVAELYRIAPSVPELGRVLDWLFGHDARFVAVLPGIDTDEEAGRLAVRTIIDVARWERQRLIERTRNGMRAARVKGPPRVADYPELRQRIAKMRAEGMTLQAIADELNTEGVPTVRGGAEWRPSSVQRAAGYHRPPAGHALAPQTGAGGRPQFNGAEG